MAGWRDPTTGEPALHVAVRHGGGALLVTALIAAGADPNLAHGRWGRRGSVKCSCSSVTCSGPHLTHHMLDPQQHPIWRGWTWLRTLT